MNTNERARAYERTLDEVRARTLEIRERPAAETGAQVGDRMTAIFESNRARRASTDGAMRHLQRLVDLGGDVFVDVHHDKLTLEECCRRYDCSRSRAVMAVQLWHCDSDGLLLDADAPCGSLTLESALIVAGLVPALSDDARTQGVGGTGRVA